MADTSAKGKILPTPRRLLGPVVLSLGLVTAAAQAEPVGTAPLNRVEADGFLIWLHSLEQTVAAREAAGQEETLVLYPFDLLLEPGSEARPYHHLAVGRALTENEQETGRTKLTLAGAGHALSMARNYLYVSEYDSAQVWLERSATLDTAGAFRGETGHEILAAAIADGDSTQIATRLDAVVNGSDVQGHEREVVLALRFLAVERQDDLLDALLARLGARAGTLSGRVRYWYAFGLACRERWGESLVQIRRLLSEEGLSSGLSEDQRAWILTALPDLLFLVGEPGTARELYGVLERSELAAVRRRAAFQLGCLDLIDARYDRAATRFTRLCESRSAASWSAQACDLAAMARELNRILAEGEAYGAAALYRP
jgi:hypothetical protein